MTTSEPRSEAAEAIASERSDALDRAGLHRTDAAALRVMALLAGLVAVGALVFAVIGAVGWLTDPGATVTLLMDRTVDPPADATEVVSIVADRAVVTATSLGTGARVALAVGELLAALTSAAVVTTIGLCLWRLAQGRPFHRSMFLATLVCGCALLFGGLLSTFATGFGRMQAAIEFNGGPEGPFVAGFEFDPIPWLVGFAVLALAFVFRAGARLQRDTDGLV